MTTEIGLSEIDLLVTTDPVVQREQVTRLLSVSVRQQGLGGRVGMIAKKLAVAIEKMQRRERWEAGLMTLALDYVHQGCCQQIYGEALRLQTEANKGGKDVNGAQSDGRRSKRKGKRG